MYPCYVYCFHKLVTLRIPLRGLRPLTSILAKISIKDVDSNLATAIRTTVIIIFTWGIVFAERR